MHWLDCRLAAVVTCGNAHTAGRLDRHASVNQLQAPTRKQKASTFHPEGYYCPQCSSKYCDLPVECRTCGLLLVASPHLARSYHHLFPLPAFREAAREMAASEECTGCGSNLTTEEDSSV